MKKEKVLKSKHCVPYSEFPIGKTNIVNDAPIEGCCIGENEDCSCDKTKDYSCECEEKKPNKKSKKAKKNLKTKKHVEKKSKFDEDEEIPIAPQLIRMRRKRLKNN